MVNNRAWPLIALRGISSRQQGGRQAGSGPQRLRRLFTCERYLFTYLAYR
jgi:hypothetical protein